jgi:hypothetical protein
VYDLVVDTPAGTRPGAFTFRVWMNDTTPPKVRLVTRSVAPGGAVRLAVTDAGSGVDPASLSVRVDGHVPSSSYARGILRVSTRGLGAGVHRVHVVVSDYEEAKNMENVGPILPNTRTFNATFAVR